MEWWHISVLFYTNLTDNPGSVDVVPQIMCYVQEKVLSLCCVMESGVVHWWK